MSDETSAEPVFHDTAWFAARIGMSEDWVRRNRRTLPHHRVGRNVKFDQHCVDALAARTAVAPQDEMRRTPQSAAKSTRSTR